MVKEHICLGKWTIKKLQRILHKSSQITDIGECIGFLSKKFIGVNYKKSTLIGEMKTKEVLVINLKEVDCFTFIDYIEAMRLSGSFLEFKENLKRVRYHSGIVSYEERNHFFTDWISSNSGLVSDVTEKIGGKKTLKTLKVLNIKKDGTYYLQGIQPRKRIIKYIPTDSINTQVLKRLKTGDYIGIYSKKKGLDVSHVGIIIKAKNKIYLRHAGAKMKKVVDEGFKGYMANKEGLVILRAK